MISLLLRGAMVLAWRCGKCGYEPDGPVGYPPTCAKCWSSLEWV